MTKQELRKIYLDKRKNLTEQEYSHFNQLLCLNFFSAIDLSGIKVLHTYLPIEKFKEPDTRLIIDRIKKEFPDIKISIPKMDGQTGLLENYFFDDAKQLELNTWGIAEPTHGIPTAYNDIDMVLVPLLAFDTQGHRIGYGKGFYDRFLKACRNDCKKIGLAFFEPVEIIEEAGIHDIKLDHVLTPHDTYSF